MKHRFYQKSKKEQNKIQLIVAVLAFTIVVAAVFIAWRTYFYLIGIITFVIVTSIIASFFDAPAMKKNGRIKYYSSLFITEKPKNAVIKVHGGTLFDYIFVLNRKMSGKQRTNFIIQQYLQGLLCLIEEYENGKTENLKITGTSYIMHQRTAQKMGFKIVETDFIQKFILIYNFFNLLISNSIAKAKFSIPNLKNIHTYEADLEALIENKKNLVALNSRLKSTNAEKKYF